MNFPLLFGGLLALFGAATMVHLLLVSVARRRTEAGLLKVLGFVRRQVAAVVSWQATAVALVGIIAGVPLGIAVGKTAWRIFATNFGVVPFSVVAGRSAGGAGRVRPRGRQRPRGAARHHRRQVPSRRPAEGRMSPRHQSRLATFRALAGNRALTRVVAGYALFVLTEYSVWIGMLVYAYARGGATVAGLVALAQLVPAALFAPFAAAIADRRSPVVLLAGGYLAQAAAMAATAAAILAGLPLAAYAAAVVASTAVTTTRPAQATLIPSLCASPDQLTAANVVVGWVEAAAITCSGLLTGLLISVGGTASVFAACAGLALIGCALVVRLRAGVLAPPEQPPAVLADLREAVRGAAERPGLRLILALLTAEAIVVGGLDLLFVILAVTVLGRPQAWAGYLNAADGAGAVLAATVSAALVGRRLGLPVLAAALALSAALGALAFGVGVFGTVALLTLVGASRALLEVASRSLLQRSVPVQLIGRIFGLLEGLTMAGLAAGALLVPALAGLGGSRLALIGVAAVLPLAALAGARHLFGLDAGAKVRVVEIALLRSLPLFAELPAPAIEGLAGALIPRDIPAGTDLIRQGERGDDVLRDRVRAASRSGRTAA